MMSSNVMLGQQEIEEVTDYLVAAIGSDYTWRWDEQKNVRLSEFASNKKEKIFASLEQLFEHKWDIKTMKHAPKSLKQQLGQLTKLKPQQVLFTSPANDNRPMLLAIWWPWGHGGTVSLRLTALIDSYEPSEISQPKDSLSTLIKKLFSNG